MCRRFAEKIKKSNAKEHKVENMISLGFLVGLSYGDLRRKEIKLSVLAAMFVAAMGYLMFFGQWKSSLLGALEGILLLGISKMTKEQLGEGDALVLIMTGILLGAGANLELFFLALLFSAVWAAGALVFCRWNRKCVLPFVPFLAAAQAVLAVLKC